MLGGFYGRAGIGTRRPGSWIARAVHALAAAVEEIRADLTRPAMNRRVVRHLSTLSERELKDIGLIRQDVVDAIGPGNGDAIRLLLGRREVRRGARAGWRRA